MILRKLALLAIVLLGIGIVTAEPCPGPHSNEWTDQNLLDTSLNVLYEDIGSNTLKILARHSNENSVGGIPGFREVCFQIPGMTQVSALWNTGGENWGADITHQQVAEFNGQQTGSSSGASGNPYNIPFDGGLHDVGTIKFASTPDVGQATSLVHIISAEKCGGYESNGEPKTCYKRPQPPLAPVPELSPLILTSSGLLGIVLISRKYRNR